METGDLKVVLHLKGGRALVGVQGDGTDPALETLTVNSLEEALAAVPGVVARARERWATSPRCPAYVGPAATPLAKPVATSAPQPTRHQEPCEGQMRPLF